MRFWSFPLKVPAYNTQTDAWYEREFLTQKEFTVFIQEGFKEEPQFYRLKNTKKWKETGNEYTRTQALTKKPNFEGGRYHDFKRNSPLEKRWRETEKIRILNGVIYDGVYVPGFYYWYLNFCPITDDVILKKRFADVWDGDLWYMQYCMLCILKGKHIGGVKGRQKGYSYKHMAILYWCYCWFENSVNTVGGYLEDLVVKSWRYLEGYRSHINSTTVWKRGPVQSKSLMWVETKEDKSGIPRGLNSKLAGVTFKQRPDNDVGGPQTFFNYEEPGISPSILETLEFIRPAVEKGTITTGTLIACGSVGKLDDAEGIRTIFYNPRDYNFLPVKNVWDTKNQKDECCIFISEAYNMLGTDINPSDEDGDDPNYSGKPFMDEDGNSDVALALSWIEKHKELMKSSTKSSTLKKLAESQKCTSPEQAFDERKVSEWPLEKIKRQQERILLKDSKNLWDFKPIKCLLTEDIDGRVKWITANLPPEHQYPIVPEWLDKRGVATIYELPVANPPMYTYFACVDPVEVDVTETSSSVASIDIFKAAVREQYTDDKGINRTRIQGDKLVFTWRGRFNTSDETNEHIWYAIKLYNAFTYPERNKPNFINWMRKHNRAELYLAKEKDVPMFKDLNIKNGNESNNSKFGFHKGAEGATTEIWKHFKATTKEYFQAEYDRNSFIDKDGKETELKVITGIDKIDDYWLLEEFRKHVEGKGNYDRMVSFMGALFICKTYEQNGFMKTVDNTKKKEEKEVYKPPRVVNLLGGANRIYTGQQRRKRPQSLL